MSDPQPFDPALALARIGALEQSIERLNNECLQLRLWTRALMYSHSAPSAFVVAVEKEREAALAEALPVAVSDASVNAIQKAADKALAIARIVDARARGLP